MPRESGLFRWPTLTDQGGHVFFCAAPGRITPSTNYQDFAHADMVVEAVFENMKIKKEIFGRLDQVCKPGAILASNTSALNVDEIAAATKRPEDVIGCHFFSPASAPTCRSCRRV